MFNSTVLEVAFGLLLCFTAVSLIVSSVNEAISSFLQLRGKYLLRSLQALLNDAAGDDIVLALYNNARLHPGGSGAATHVRQLRALPSYVAPGQFAVALTDVLQLQAGPSGGLLLAIEAVVDVQLRQVLLSMYQRAGAELPRFEVEVAYWFEQSMQRLAGKYKRTLQWWTVLIGMLLAMLMNIDALHLFKVLWAHPALMQGMGAAQLVDARGAMANLNVTSLPIGWERAPFTYADGMLRSPYGAGQFALMAAGWALTALSTLFGAPFWFDLLQRVTNLRGTGPKVS